MGFAERLFRESCVYSGNGYVKDLRRLGMDLKVLKLAELTVLGENLLPEFLGRLRKLESCVDRTGQMIQSIGLSIGRLQNLRKLSLFTHHPQRFSFLPPCLPPRPARLHPSSRLHPSFSLSPH
jgi:hypothetical protein